jgi:hypothetical protein
MKLQQACAAYGLLPQPVREAQQLQTVPTVMLGIPALPTFSFVADSNSTFRINSSTLTFNANGQVMQVTR